MSLAKYRFELTGLTNLLMSSDDIDKGDMLMAWRKDPSNKSFSVPGDDRSPAWSYMTRLYSDEQHITMPSANIMGALKKAGAMMTIKGNKTFKSATQSGLLIDREHCDFFVDHDGSGYHQINIADVVAIKDLSFAEQCVECQKLGFNLHKKRVPVGSAKHIRVRPMFKNWKVTGTILVMMKEISRDILEQLFSLSGTAGLGDWRPSAPKSPGPWGQYTSTITSIK